MVCGTPAHGLASCELKQPGLIMLLNSYLDELINIVNLHSNIGLRAIFKNYSAHLGNLFMQVLSIIQCWS